MSSDLCTGLGRRDGSLHLEIRGADGKQVTRPLEPGAELAFELGGARECIGYRPPGGQSLIPCPSSVIGVSASQCDDCFAAAHILPCLRCKGDRCNNPARRKECVQPENHAVYLASFGPGSDLLKVGVARWERRAERLIEQGARAALIVARDDGQLARRVEHQIERAGVADRLYMHVKLYGLTQAASREQLHDELREALGYLKPRVIGVKWLPHPEEVELPELPLLPEFPRVLSLATGLRVRGELEAIAGQTALVASDSGERVAFDLAGLVGHRIRTLADDEVGVGQLALAF